MENNSSEQSLRITLEDIGFNEKEIQIYLDRNDESERFRMLEERRRSVLNEIHRKEEQLKNIDYLRYQYMHGKGGREQ